MVAAVAAVLEGAARSTWTRRSSGWRQWGLISPDTSFKDLLQQAPIGGGDAVTMVLAHAVGICRRHLRHGHHPAADVLHAGRIAAHFRFLRAAVPARDRRRRWPRSASWSPLKISAWLGGQMLPRLDHRHHDGDRLLGLMGVPYFFVLAVIAGIGEMIPMVGPLLSAIPAVLVAFTVSPGLALGVAVFFLVLQQLENNVLVPKVMGETVGLNAVTVISVAGHRQRAARLRRRAARGADRGDHSGAVRRAVSGRERSGVKRWWSGPSAVCRPCSTRRSLVVLTWPLVLGIGSDVPGDLGDSLLNMWILGWGAEHVPAPADRIDRLVASSGTPTSSIPIRSRSRCPNICSARRCRSCRSTG